MAAAVRELRDPFGWALAVLTGLANLALRVSPLKAAGVAVVVLAVKIAAGVAWPRPAEPPRVRGRPIAGSKLTSRELEVASFTPKGLSNKEIGKKLVPPVRERGVDSTIRNIMMKLNVHSREEIGAWYVRHFPDSKP